MCSILCYAGKDVTKETMEGYLLKTKMRGPDAQRVVETEFGYLGFARLAIMGLTPGRHAAVSTGRQLGDLQW